MTDTLTELEKVRGAWCHYMSNARPETRNDFLRAFHSFAPSIDTIIAKQKATEEALRVAAEGLGDIADIKKHEVESCASARYTLAKINTILQGKEPTE